MLGIKAIWAILAGAVVVGGVGTYVFLENSNPEDPLMEVSNNSAISALEVPQKQVTKPLGDSNTDENSEVKEAGANDGADSLVKEVVVSAEAPTENWKMPAFDVLRVEPDGSTVIAGQGQPNTTLKVMNGDEVLNEVKIGPTGDFAVIFDQPLDSGDYQLTLKIEDEDGNVLVSEETATVSVPEDTSGQLLAMVTKPGQASRILAQPEASVPAATMSPVKLEEKVEVAVSTAITKNSVDVKKDVSAALADKQESSVAASKQIKEVVEASELKANEDDAIKKADNSGTSNLVNEPAAEKPAATKMARLDDKAPNTNNNASVVDKDVVLKDVEIVQEATTENAKGVATKIVEIAKLDTKVEEAVKTVETSSQKPMDKPAEKTVADVQPKSDPIVRIEAVEVEGDKLFVAGVASRGNTVRILVDDNVVGSVDVNREGRFLIETQQELSVGSHMITAALEDKTTKEIVLRAVVPFNRPEAKAAAAIAAPEAKIGEQEIAVASKEESSADTKDTTMVKTELASNSVETQKPEDEKKLEPVITNSSDDKIELKEGDAEKVADMIKDEPQTIVQDTLTPSASQSVIIRKGDTLWQIARRTYGAGVRYTTIYLANQEQILNPDRIAPGQIFMVPEEALENAEELHLKRLQGN